MENQGLLKMLLNSQRNLRLDTVATRIHWVLIQSIEMLAVVVIQQTWDLKSEKAMTSIRTWTEQDTLRAILQISQLRCHAEDSPLFSYWLLGQKLNFTNNLLILV